MAFVMVLGLGPSCLFDFCSGSWFLHLIPVVLCFFCVSDSVLSLCVCLVVLQLCSMVCPISLITSCIYCLHFSAISLYPVLQSFLLVQLWLSLNFPALNVKVQSWVLLWGPKTCVPECSSWQYYGKGSLYLNEWCYIDPWTPGFALCCFFNFTKSFIDTFSCAKSKNYLTEK